MKTSNLTLNLKGMIFWISLVLLNLNPLITHASSLDQQTNSDIQVVYRGGSTAFEMAAYQANLAVEAVLMASRLTGGYQLVTYGTLTQFAPDYQSFQYSPTPQDRLKVILHQGKTLEFVIKDFRGNLSLGASQFLSQNHALDFEGREEGVYDIHVTSLQWEGQRQGQIKGKTLFENVTYQFDLAVLGSYFFEVDSTGSEYKSDFTLKGAVHSPRMQVNVDESRFFRMITTRGTRTESVSNASNTTNNTATTSDGHNYQFQNAIIRKAFRDGKPNEPEYWLGQGVLLKDGQALGQIQLGYETEKAIFWLKLNGSGEGEKIVLESWQLWDPNRRP